MTKKILLCGGGTLGPVTPLIAVIRRMRQLAPGLEFAWAGTPDGPEKSLVAREGIPFYAVKVAKLARFPSLNWLTFPFDYTAASAQAAQIIKLFKPDLVVGAGGFTQVPVMHQALRSGISCAIHQLDRDPVRSNSLLAKRAAMVTCSLGWYGKELAGKAQKVKTPCRFDGVTTESKKDAAAKFKLDATRPIVFVTGGGTGARSLNRGLTKILTTLLAEMQVIHLTGKDKGDGAIQRSGYFVSDTFDEAGMLSAYAAADLVVSRGGFGSLSELAALSKPAVIVPLPGPQTANTQALKGAILEVSQDFGFENRLAKEIRDLLANVNRRQELGKRLHLALPTDDGSELAQKWLGLV
ncbi:MAG: glycosyltransferase [Patescibacteria group bacterium]